MIVNYEGLNNTVWDIYPCWGKSCCYREMTNSDYAEHLLGIGACAISIYKQRPPEAVLIAWREDKDTKTPFMKKEDPLVIVMNAEGNVAEFYSLD